MNSFLEEKTFELEVEKLERPCSAEKERGGVARYPWYRVLCKEIMVCLGDREDLDVARSDV